MSFARHLSTSTRQQVNKKPLLRPWFYHHKYQDSPANGEFDYNSGKGDYFFGKPYFVHNKAKDIFYEQIGWINSTHTSVKVVLLKDLVYETDEEGTQASGSVGDVISLTKDMGRAMVNNLDALYATPENIKFVESTTDSTGETKEQLALKKKYSWLELADLSIDFKAESGWTVTEETIARRLLVCNKIVVPAENITVLDDSLVRLGDVEPRGVLKISIAYDGNVSSIEKSIDIGPSE